MAFYNNVKWVLGILVVFLLIVATNLIDRNNFVRVRESVETLYEDRLIANDLLFELAKTVQENEIAVHLSDTSFFRKQKEKANTDIQRFISRYEQTKLTKEERLLFDNLKMNIQTILKLEPEFINSRFKNKNEILHQISLVKENLYDLTKIQLNEGSRQMSISKQAIDTVELFTQIEIYFLAFLAILIQIIVMYKPKES
ncbi:MAG: chemotaxis protein [Bacteroidetes bacterium]|nr:chemotaxis protein [Bacteroidota bacterium]NCQ11085.1 chemotaxis protein [Bacteroidota bacterium]